MPTIASLILSPWTRQSTSVSPHLCAPPPHNLRLLFLSSVCKLHCRLSCGPQGTAALRPIFGQLRRHPAGAPPACPFPRSRGAAHRALLCHVAPTPPGRATAPQQRRPGSDYFPHGASSLHTPAAAMAVPAAHWGKEAPSVLRRRPGRWGQQLPWIKVTVDCLAELSRAVLRRTRRSCATTAHHAARADCRPSHGARNHEPHALEAGAATTMTAPPPRQSSSAGRRWQRS